jgi:hypothetical protein
MVTNSIRYLVCFRVAMNAFLEAFSQPALPKEDTINLPLMSREASRMGYVSLVASIRLAT